ncbi:MAG: hypothetical protein D6680_11370 [Cyanobacteria bacterium J007]|nr:MAG: hypothetical protein D6680_11370 [Cyanobacteria bacterium J007]
MTATGAIALRKKVAKWESGTRSPEFISVKIVPIDQLKNLCKGAELATTTRNAIRRGGSLFISSGRPNMPLERAAVRAAIATAKQV